MFNICYCILLRYSKFLQPVQPLQYQKYPKNYREPFLFRMRIYIKYRTRFDNFFKISERSIYLNSIPVSQSNNFTAKTIVTCRVSRHSLTQHLQVSSNRHGILSYIVHTNSKVNRKKDKNGPKKYLILLITLIYIDMKYRTESHNSC